MLSLFSSRVILPLAVLPLALMLASCAGGADDDTLLVFAATSLTDAMTEVAAEYEATSGTNVEISFGPSRALAQQIVRGANPDLYFAAGQPPMDLLQDGGQVAQDGVVRLLSNKIVLITGTDAPNFGNIDALADSGLNRIAMPDPEIAPAGNYTRTALQNLGLWERLLPSIVFANDVRATLEYVESGNADGSSHDGFNRVWWNFRGPDANPIHYRTKPQFADWMPMPEVSRQVGGGFFGFGGGPRQPPGTYTVTLVVDGEDVGSEELTVLRDPSSEGSMADILAQKALLDDIVEDRNRLADAVNQIELLRRQIYDLRPVLEEAGDAEDVLEAGEALDESLIEVEGELVQLKNTGPDGVRWPSMIAGRLQYLQGTVGTADFPPTDQHAEVAQLLSDQIDEVVVRLEAVLADELAEFNRMLQARVGRVITTDDDG